MLRFIDACAEYVLICPYYKPTRLTYFLVVSFLILLTYVFILPILMSILIFIMAKSSLFAMTFLFLSCYYLAEINKYYEDYYN